MRELQKEVAGELKTAFVELDDTTNEIEMNLKNNLKAPLAALGCGGASGVCLAERGLPARTAERLAEIHSNSDSFASG